ncbi:putative leucine-rich repeat-containing protein DDB_G0290503 [Maniola hyperantus]|uniref:putative leucine-rich repeat-containing protein DDB_G0290503 n=1 Tax=Aphantopus hyperantus TaxID=2795564 RepID=UPI001568BA74|nr:uncharacterized protein LOC117985227 [Maniola hyperantus]
MDDIKRMLKDIQNDINATKDSIKNSETILLKKIDEKFDQYESSKEKERSYQDLLKIILEIFNSSMKVNCTTSEIEYMRRKGKKSSKTRPIMITLTTFGKKIEILQNKKLLEKTNYYIKEDYPPKVLEKRKELQDKLIVEREKGNRAYIKYDKLIILPQKENCEEEKPRNKRNLSVTPPDNQTKHTKKTSKINPTHLQKKNTLSSYWTPKQSTKSTPNESFFSPEPSASFHIIDQEE